MYMTCYHLEILYSVFPSHEDLLQHNHSMQGHMVNPNPNQAIFGSWFPNLPKGSVQDHTSFWVLTVILVLQYRAFSVFSNFLISDFEIYRPITVAKPSVSACLCFSSLFYFHGKFTNTSVTNTCHIIHDTHFGYWSRWLLIQLPLLREGTWGVLCWGKFEAMWCHQSRSCAHDFYSGPPPHWTALIGLSSPIDTSSNFASSA